MAASCRAERAAASALALISPGSGQRSCDRLERLPERIHDQVIEGGVVDVDPRQALAARLGFTIDLAHMLLRAGRREPFFLLGTLDSLRDRADHADPQRTANW